MRGVPLDTIATTMTAEQLSALIQLAFKPMDLLFLAIIVYEGYKFSFRYRLRRPG